MSMISRATETFQFDAIDDVLSDIAKGRMVIVTDDADRENEGDLVMAAEKVTPEAVNFHGDARPGLDLRAAFRMSAPTSSACNAWWRKTEKSITPTSPFQWTRRAV